MSLPKNDVMDLAVESASCLTCRFGRAPTAAELSRFTDVPTCDPGDEPARPAVAPSDIHPEDLDEWRICTIDDDGDDEPPNFVESEDICCAHEPAPKEPA